MQVIEHKIKVSEIIAGYENDAETGMVVSGTYTEERVINKNQHF